MTCELRVNSKLLLEMCLHSGVQRCAKTQIRHQSALVSSHGCVDGL